MSARVRRAGAETSGTPVPPPGDKACGVCAALVRQRAQARENGDEAGARECEEELANHHHLA
ncbi:hypothetical protein [Streptomyces montanisoli]|uniref:Uncharacterized protein n=1 Tax=Streptomyces montanisoli TaxID=2798581 RepID=A0A940MG92_9ACTN|nr:hypothetical protein [Streptomyces montanisoli]MBP0459470.1 hypothetical protein [Streptomyces montanisoli]